jgi:hypothetical protein
MRSLLVTFLFSILCATAMAQAGSVKVYNNTSCRVYYRLYGDIALSCGGSYSSGGYQTTPPYGTITWYPGVIYLTGSDYINYAVAHPQPACIVTALYAAGEPCSGQPLVSSYYYGKDFYCQDCSHPIRMIWTPAPAPGGQAILTFDY